MTGIDIPPVAQSAFELIGDSQEERDWLDQFATEIGNATNWFARKKMFIDLLDALDATAAAAADAFDPEVDAVLADHRAGDLPNDAIPALAPEPAVEPRGGRSDDPGFGDLADDVLEDELLSDDLFAEVAPLYVAAILERLNEKRIDCLEQAAIYFVSAQPEHYEAASAWLGASDKRLHLFRKFIKANPGYDGAARRILAADEFGDEPVQE